MSLKFTQIIGLAQITFLILGGREDTKEGDDEEATVTGDMFVSLVAKCPIQEEFSVNSNCLKLDTAFIWYFYEVIPLQEKNHNSFI